MIVRIALLSLLTVAQKVEKLFEFENKLQDVFSKHGIVEEMKEAKDQAKQELVALKNGDIYEKANALSDIINPISEDLIYVSGDEFVSSMSQEAVKFYADAETYWATAGNLTAFNSRYWGSKVPKQGDRP